MIINVGRCAEESVEPRCEVVGTVAMGVPSGSGCQLQPDIVVVDIGMPGLNGWTPPGNSNTLCPK